MHARHPCNRYIMTSKLYIWSLGLAGGVRHSVAQFLRGEENLTPTEEIALSKKYWVDEHKMTFPIGIDVTPVNPDSTKAGSRTATCRRPTSRTICCMAYPR